MATGNEYNTLRDLLKAIADAIRSKVGDVGLISAQDFPTNINAIVKATGNATADQVLSGATFSNSSGESTGTMTNNGAVSESISPGGSYTVPACYHNGSGTVSASMPSGNAGTGDVLSGKTFSNSSTNGATGTMTNRGAWSTTINPGGSVTIPSGYHSGGGKVSANKNSLVPSSVVSNSGGNGVELTTNSKLVAVGALGFDWDHPQAQIQLYFDGSWKNADSYGLVRSTRIYDSNPEATYSVWVNTKIIDKTISKVRVVGIWDGDISKCDICAFKGS